MKSLLRYLLLACLVMGMATTVTSCSGDEEENLQDEITTIDVNNLYGEWNDMTSGYTTEHWYFDTDYTGVYWDADESSREQASTGNKAGLFKWELTETGLMRFFWMETLNTFDSQLNSGDPALIEELTASRLIYVTNNGKGTRHSLSKVQ